MSNIITTNQRIQALEAQLQQRSIRPNRAFRRVTSALRYGALCRDAEALHDEAMRSKQPTWADM